MSADINDRLHEIVEAAKARRDAAARISGFIESELAGLRCKPRTAGAQHMLLGMQRELKEDEAAAMHIIADAAGVRP